MDAGTLYRNIQSWLRIAVFLSLPQKPGMHRDYLMCGYFSLNGFKAGFPYTAEPIIIVRFCDTVAGTPADNAHPSRAALAFSDLGGPFLETEIRRHHRCF